MNCDVGRGIPRGRVTPYVTNQGSMCDCAKKTLGGRTLTWGEAKALIFTYPYGNILPKACIMRLKMKKITSELL